MGTQRGGGNSPPTTDEASQDARAAIDENEVGFGLSDIGVEALRKAGLQRYCSEGELHKLYRIVAIVERVFTEN